jgi:hypothetical protein
MVVDCVQLELNMSRDGPKPRSMIGGHVGLSCAGTWFPSPILLQAPSFPDAYIVRPSVPNFVLNMVNLHKPLSDFVTETFTSSNNPQST